MIKEKVDKNLEKPAKKAKIIDNESDESDFEDEREGGISVGGIYIPPPPLAVCSVENVGPRLIITKIVNINFKSYAGRQELGPFHKNFTSIIGPNGSGKSNVIDSMLFVFGYRATKIRSKKLSVLIHNSEKHKNIRSCTVEVHFVRIIDKGKDYEVVPNSDLVIARTANTDNQSQYSINGKNSRFKEVALLLRSHGIDLVHNRFLILQGEVEQIAMMKTKGQNEHETGMLEYLEDIIGTSRYKTPLQKLEKKVEELSNERQEKINRLDVAEKDKNSLEGPMYEAVEYIIVENKYIRMKNKIYQLNIMELRVELKHHQQRKKEIDDVMSDLKKCIKQFTDELSSKETEISVKNKNLESVKAKREQLKENIAKSEKQSTELKLDIGHSNTKRKKCKDMKKEMEQKLANLQNIPEKNTKEIEQLKKVEEKLIKKRTEEEAIVEKTLASLQEETQGLQDNMTQLSNELVGLKNIKDDANARYEVAKTELDVYKNKEEKEKTKLDKLQSSLAEIIQRLQQEKKNSSEAAVNLPKAEIELKQSENELASVKQEEYTIGQEINSLMAKTHEKRNLMQDNRSRGRVLDFIMKQKERGVVPGVFGRLGDLGGIDAKYDCAISTACGPLDYIVTDNVATAKKCVELLKSNNVGRGNFIALDQQEHLKSRYMRPIKTPENIPRLFDLIKVNDERVRPAFYFGLQDTLVATDLSQAKRCAYGNVRYRVVTLNGEIIEIVGTMSGGGREKRMGRMGRSATVITDDSGTTKDLEQAEQQLAALKERSTVLQQRRAILEQAIYNLTNNIKLWKKNQSTSKFELKELQRQEGQLKQQIENQKPVVENAAVNPEVVQEMSEKIKLLKEEFDVAAKNSDKVEAEVKKVRAKIEAATGGRMKEVRQKLEKTTTQLKKVTAEITKLGVDIRASARDEVKTINRISTLSTEISESESSILKAEELSNGLLKKIEKFSLEMEEFNRTIGEGDKQIRELKSQTNELNKKISGLKATKLNEDQQLESVEKIIHEHEHGIGQKKKLLEDLKLNEIPKIDDKPLPGFENRLESDEIYVDELPTFTYEEMETWELEGLKYNRTLLDEQLGQLRNNLNLNVISEYLEKVSLVETRRDEYTVANDQRNEARKGFDEVRKARLNEFMAGFAIITSKLKEMYQMITLGGDAEFDLVDTLDPFSEGVLFSVRPPKKSWKNISNLSGGEKTLSSLALVFALHYYKPSPLYVMDEIDAALDFKNVSIVANYIKERTKNAQFIIISLRSNMFELADVLVGIYKTYNCTKSVTVFPELCLGSNNNDNNEKENDGPPKKKSKYET